jgi:hypothetical protein
MNQLRVTAWVSLGTFVAVARPAYAQPTAKPTESAEARSPATAATSRGAGVDDVVYLKDGSMLRGAIIERIPSDSVTLLLPNGQTRRFKFDEVTYAGAVSSAPGAASVSAPPLIIPPAATGATARPSAAAGTTPLPAGSALPPAAPAALAPPPPPPEEVHFKAAEPLAFSVFAGTSEGLVPGFRWTRQLTIDNYRLLCSAPCTEVLKKGRYRFSLTRDGNTVPSEEEVVVSPGDTVTGQYESFAETRWIGVGVWGVGTAGGLTYAIAGASTDHRSNNFVIGGVIGLASALVGGILMAKQDKATVEVTAGVAPAPAATEGNGASDRPGLALFQPRGLTLSARF